MDAFDRIVNWKLKRGSHPFPGPDGGTCINEAALVAAGFHYKPIAHVTQMPKGALSIEEGIEILEGALAIGRQAEPLAPETARTRLEAVRGKPLTASPKPNRPLSAKLKAWFTTKVLEPVD